MKNDKMFSDRTEGDGSLICSAATRRTPFEIAESWYDAQSVHRSILRCRDLKGPSSETVPTDVHSEEFAKWLTTQYRLAMAKGVQLGRDGSEDQPYTSSK